MKIYVWARDYVAAHYISVQLNLGRPTKDWLFLHEARQLYGLNELKLVSYGPYYEHPNYEEITEAVRKLEAIGVVEWIDANG